MIDAILYGQGAQTIRWVPVDAQGIVRRVTSATYAIVDLREPLLGSRREIVASTAATASTVSTTIAAAAGPSTAAPKRITVASLTGIRVGGHYLLSNTSSAIEEPVEVSRINVASLELELVHPLTRGFVSGSALVGLELDGTFPSGDANDEQRLDNGGGPLQVTWSYTIGSVLYVAPQILWVTRYGVAPWVTPAGVLRHLPGHAQVVGDSLDPAGAIRAATDELYERLQSAGTWRRDPAALRANLSTTLFVEKWALALLLRGSRSEAALALAQTYADEANSHVNNILVGAPGGRVVASHPVDDTAKPGGEKLASGGYFLPG